jgi:magnesium transporter
MIERRQVIVLESVRRFLRRSAHTHLLNLLAKVRPPDFGPVYEKLSERERVALFRLLATRDPELGAGFLVELPHESGPDLLRLLGPDAAARLLEKCAEDDAADLLARLDEDESRQVLDGMRPEEKAGVEKLLIYADETAGRIMTPDVFSLHEDTTIEKATAALRTRESIEIAFYLYVVDDRKHLVGVISLRELLLNPADTKLKEIMNADLITVRTDADQEEVARIASKYDLLAIPVVDEQGRLAGAVSIDDVIDVLREEATEDILRMAGTSEEERIQPSIGKSVRTRAPWLAATFLGGLAAAVIIYRLSGILAGFVGLAAFFPIILGTAGSAGNQSATVIMRGLATGRIREGMYLATLAREAGVGALLGLAYGVLLVLGSSLIVGAGGISTQGTSGVVRIAVVIGLSLALSIAAATILGSVVPLVLQHLNLDPATSTSPLVTSAVDVMASLIFLGLASLALAASAP